MHREHECFIGPPCAPVQVFCTDFPEIVHVISQPRNRKTGIARRCGVEFPGEIGVVAKPDGIAAYRVARVAVGGGRPHQCDFGGIDNRIVRRGDKVETVRRFVDEELVESTGYIDGLVPACIKLDCIHVRGTVERDTG